jgi:hypothetical protein|tara:strand:+ start:77 stop:241 length:165 start_codon:yes stop_codon:yes gene_type:complete
MWLRKKEKKMIEFLAILMVVVGVEGALLVLKYEVDYYEVNYTQDVFVPKQFRDY